MQLEDAICKLVGIIAKKELTDISIIETDAHIMPVLMEIDPQNMSSIDVEASGFRKAVETVEAYLELNAIQKGIDVDINALENRDIDSLKSFMLKVFAIFYVFSPESFTQHVSQMEEDEFPELLTEVKHLSADLKDDITRLYTRVSIDEKTYLNSLMKKVSTYENEINKLNDHINKLQAKIDETGYESKDLVQTIAEKNDEIKTLTIIKDATLRENDNLMAKNTSLQSTIDKLKEEKQESSKQYTKLDEEFSKLNNMVADYKETLNTYRTQFENFKAREKLFEDALQKLSVYEEKVNNYDKLLADNQELKNFITLLHSRNKKLQEQVSIEIDKIIELRNTVKQLEKQNYNAAAEANLLENQIKDLKNELKIYKSNTRNNLINKYIDDMHNMNESRVTQLNADGKENGNEGLARQASVPSLYVEKINTLNKEILELKEKLRVASGEPLTKEKRDEEIEALLSELDNLNKRYGQLRDIKDGQEIEIVDLKSDNDELRKELSKLKFKNSERAIQRIESLKKEDMEHLKQQLEVKNSIINDLNDQVELLNKLLTQKEPKNHEQQLMDLIEAKNREIEDLKKRASLRASMHNSRAKSFDATIQADIPSTKEVAQNEKIMQLQNDKTSLLEESKRSMKDLTRALDVRDSAPYKRLEEQYSKLKMERDNILAECDDMKLRIKSLEANDIDGLKKELADKKSEIKQLKTGQQMVRHENEDLKRTVELKNQEIEALSTRQKNQKDALGLDFNPKRLSNASNMSLCNNFMSREAHADEQKEDEPIDSRTDALHTKDYRRYDDYNLLYSVFMDYMRSHLDLETQRKERNAELRSNLTSGFALGKLLI